jgi:hypothetical protein
MCRKGLGKDEVNRRSGEKLKGWVSQKSMNSEGIHTPYNQAMLNKNDAFPTNIFGLILLINPGRVGVMENSSATAALQFYK